MTQIKRSWDVLSKEQRDQAINTIIDYFSTEKDEKLGILAADELLDVFYKL